MSLYAYSKQSDSNINRDKTLWSSYVHISACSEVLERDGQKSSGSESNAIHSSIDRDVVGVEFVSFEGFGSRLLEFSECGLWSGLFAIVGVCGHSSTTESWIVCGSLGLIGHHLDANNTNIARFDDCTVGVCSSNFLADPILPGFAHVSLVSLLARERSSVKFAALSRFGVPFSRLDSVPAKFVGGVLVGPALGCF